FLSRIIEKAGEQQPFLMGILVAVLMGIFLTLPISSAAIGIMLQLDGVVAGAAVVGCCCHMVGYAVMSFRENKWGGLVAQGIGTSMLQMPNLVKKPILWLPPIISSAILGPISSCALGMVSTPVGSGMGTAGLVGVIETFTVMSETQHWALALLQIVGVDIIAPAILCLVISELMRKIGWIKFGDLKLDL
ncbi:MAG: PTS sugar transporter subunit IIC, partial [Clostridia bacterium]|nr:PTS sugar transporter subunit IIC [Clostridia bacterium]